MNYKPKCKTIKPHIYRKYWKIFYDFLKAISKVQVVKEQIDKLNFKIKNTCSSKSEEKDKPHMERKYLQII